MTQFWGKYGKASNAPHEKHKQKIKVKNKRLDNFIKASL
jgi:hypothetical protein